MVPGIAGTSLDRESAGPIRGANPAAYNTFAEIRRKKNGRRKPGGIHLPGWVGFMLNRCLRMLVIPRQTIQQSGHFAGVHEWASITTRKE